MPVRAVLGKDLKRLGFNLVGLTLLNAVMVLVLVLVFLLAFALVLTVAPAEDALGFDLASAAIVRVPLILPAFFLLLLLLEAAAEAVAGTVEVLLSAVAVVAVALAAVVAGILNVCNCFSCFETVTYAINV